MIGVSSRCAGTLGKTIGEKAASPVCVLQAMAVALAGPEPRNWMAASVLWAHWLHWKEWMPELVKDMERNCGAALSVKWPYDRSLTPFTNPPGIFGFLRIMSWPAVVKRSTRNKFANWHLRVVWGRTR